MTRICFVSYEIHPTTRGGAGVLLYNAARVLLAQGHCLSFLLYIPEYEFTTFRDVDRLCLPHPENCAAYHVPTLCADTPLTAADFATEFEWRAYCFHYAAQKVAALENPQLIEFFDYCGVAYYALAAKLTQGAYPHSLLTIRLHNSLEVMDAHEATKTHDWPRYMAYALEHSALRMAEATLYPSPAYLRQYQTYYQPWFGPAFHSPPPLVDYPRPDGVADVSNVVLFYGRLYGFKGVDLFVEAAVNLLVSQPQLNLQFVLVGHDSGEAPDGSPSYQEYLLKKIPAAYQPSFNFAGHLSWPQFSRLLSRVQFAVIPSYFESFCYAAHELYAAGIPLIVSPIAAFADYFKPEDNALVFDGTVSDLTAQMSRLAATTDLRRRLSCPYSLAGPPLGDFYTNPPPPATWLADFDSSPNLPSCLICVLDDRSPADLEITLRSLRPQSLPSEVQLVVLKPETNPNPAYAAIWLFGQTYHLADSAGQIFNPTVVKTAETVLILRSGDTLHPDFLPLARSTLARQSQLSFVSSWKQCGSRLDTFSIDLALELLPFKPDHYFNRALLRSTPGQLLIDLFDRQLAQLSEVGYLWQLEDTVGPGLTIPATLVTTLPDHSPALSFNQLAYLAIKNLAPHRQRRLSRFAVSNFTWQNQVMQHHETTRNDLHHVTQELAAVRATKGWQLLTHYWTIRDWIKGLLRR